MRFSSAECAFVLSIAEAQDATRSHSSSTDHTLIVQLYDHSHDIETQNGLVRFDRAPPQLMPPLHYRQGEDQAQAFGQLADRSGQMHYDIRASMRTGTIVGEDSVLLLVTITNREPRRPRCSIKN